MLSMTSPPDVQLGVQTPRVHHVPPAVSSAAVEAVELAESCGLYLDPWQQTVLEGGLGERDDGRWSAFEVGLEVGRQNGKGAILEARELAGLFLFGEQLIVHSAHLFETSMEHMERMLRLIESNPDLDRGVHRVSRAHGQEGITLTRKYGSRRLKFKTRTKGGGRGLTGHLVVIDEAMEVSDAAMSALMPTLSAIPNPQLWYAGSAVDQMIHANGLVFARLRERGHTGNDPSLAWFEWSVDPDVYNQNPMAVATDPQFWAVGNPGMGYRITSEYIANEQRSLDPRGFATERLGIGDWPDTSGGSNQVIPAPVWQGLLDEKSKIDGSRAFAIDTTPERDFTAIGVAGLTEDGRRHVEVVDHRAGTRWVVGEMVRLVEKWTPCCVMIDGKGPAASLIPELEAAGIGVAGSDGPSKDDPLVKATVQDMAQACGAMFDAAHNDELRHLGQSWLDRALAAAKTRDLGDAWAWARKSGGDISPLVAVTLAAHGHALYGRKRSGVPMVAWV